MFMIHNATIMFLLAGWKPDPFFGVFSLCAFVGVGWGGVGDVNVRVHLQSQWMLRNGNENVGFYHWKRCAHWCCYMIESTRYANKMCQNPRFKQFQIRNPLICDVPFSPFLNGLRSTKQGSFMKIRSRNHPARMFFIFQPTIVKPGLFRFSEILLLVPATSTGYGTVS